MSYLIEILANYFTTYSYDISLISIKVASFSFSIAGTVILRPWSIENSDKKIKEQFLHRNEILWGYFGEDGLTTTLKKEDLQENTQVRYRKVFAFIDIIIGYIFAVFSGETPLSNWCILGLIIVSTSVILSGEWVLSKIISKKKYPKDLKQNDYDIK